VLASSSTLARNLAAGVAAAGVLYVASHLCPESISFYFWNYVGERYRWAKKKAENANKPRRIILMRHGESEGNVDPTIYSRKPDNKVELTENGHLQAKEAGKALKKLVGSATVRFIVSP
jgi:hypothetical protein